MQNCIKNLPFYLSDFYLLTSACTDLRCQHDLIDFINSVTSWMSFLLRKILFNSVQIALVIAKYLCGYFLWTQCSS